LFQAGDKLLKVEALRLTSRTMSWKLCEDNNHQFQWQLNNLAKQTFLFLPITFQGFLLLKVNNKISLTEKMQQKQIMLVINHEF
jgi:hypothetical protein